MKTQFAWRELEEGIPIFRATYTVQQRIESLLDKQEDTSLTKSEIQELDLYEEVVDYLSFVNRTIRNGCVLFELERAQATC